VDVYTHADNSFENHEISISRLFLAINFHTAFQWRRCGLSMSYWNVGVSARCKYTWPVLLLCPVSAAYRPTNLSIR